MDNNLYYRQSEGILTYQELSIYPDYLRKSVHKLLTKAWYDYEVLRNQSLEVWISTVEELLNTDTKRILVAYNNLDEVVGIAVFDRTYDIHVGYVWAIMTQYISAEYRGLGFAREVYRWVKRLRSSGEPYMENKPVLLTHMRKDGKGYSTTYWSVDENSED